MDEKRGAWTVTRIHSYTWVEHGGITANEDGAASAIDHKDASFCVTNNLVRLETRDLWQALQALHKTPGECTTLDSH